MLYFCSVTIVCYTFLLKYVTCASGLLRTESVLRRLDLLQDPTGLTPVYPHRHGDKLSFFK
jgi:hypothetical protein